MKLFAPVFRTALMTGCMKFLNAWKYGPLPLPQLLAPKLVSICTGSFEVDVVHALDARRVGDRLPKLNQPLLFDRTAIARSIIRRINRPCCAQHQIEAA